MAPPPPLSLLVALLLPAAALQPPPVFSALGFYGGGAPSATAQRYAAAAGNASSPCSLEPRVRCHVGVWASRPAKTPSPNVQDGPLLGNGDLGAVMAAPEGVSNGNALLLYLGKSDLWATNLDVDNPTPNVLPTVEFYQMLGAGFLAIGPGDIPGGPPPDFSAAQDLATATVAASLGAVSTSTIIAADANVLLMNFSFAGAAPLEYNISLIVESSFDLPMTAGVDLDAGGQRPPVIWASRSGVKAIDNGLTLMPCDSGSYVIWPSVNTFSVDGATGRLALLNASAPPPLQCPKQVGAAKISLGDCADAGTDGGASDWRLVAAAPAAAPPGALQLQRFGSSPALCAWATPPAYHNSGGPVSVGPCDAQADAWWAWDAGEARLHYNATQCLSATPPNVNVTLGLAFSILGPDGAATPLLATRASPPSGGGATLSSTAVALLQPNTTYTFVLAALSSRDTAAAGEGPADPVAAAVAAARALDGAPDAVAALRAGHAAFWAGYWAASSVYLGEQRQLVEAAWYGLQHLLGSTARRGKVAPGLWGVWNALDTAEWNGGE